MRMPLVFFVTMPYFIWHKRSQLQGKIMKKLFCVLLLILLNTVCAWGIQSDRYPAAGKPEVRMRDAAMDVFRQNIPSVARQFIGTPYEWGGNPLTSGTSDNSYLFFAIYARAAQRAGLAYRGYLPMSNLLENTRQISEDQIEYGDLMVLSNQLAAMVFHIEATGRIHLIYTSEKRNQVISFHSDNPVFDAFWMKHLMGFYRLKDTMFR
jgi:hypothetical protein